MHGQQKTNVSHNYISYAVYEINLNSSRLHEFFLVPLLSH